MLEIVIHAFSVLLVPTFFVGMAGSSLVVLITIVHDVRDFFASDEGLASAEEMPSKQSAA